MSYNGIGLASVRGSGTNGYVTRNFAAIRPRQKIEYREIQDAEPKHRAPNKDLLEHDAKRRLEVRLMEYRMKLEDLGMADEEIDSKVEMQREKLLAEFSTEAALRDNEELLAIGGSHMEAEVKQREMSRFKSAVGIAEDHVEGEGFDEEAQARRREERMQQREEERDRRKREWEERRKEREQRDSRRRRSRRDDSRERDYRRSRRDDSRERDYRRSRRDDSRERDYRRSRRDDSRERDYRRSRRDGSRDRDYRRSRRDDSRDRDYRRSRRSDSNERKGSPKNRSGSRSPPAAHSPSTSRSSSRSSSSASR